MKFSIVLIYILFICCSSNGQTIPAQVSIKGNLKNFSNDQQLEDFSELSELRLPNQGLQIIKKSNGDFSLSFALSKPNYFRLGRNILYLQPGDYLEVQIDFHNPSLAKFSGNGSDANSFLSGIPFLKEGSFIDGGLNIKPDINKTIDTILFLANKRRALLNNNPNLTNEFKRLENARIDADLINSFKYLPGVFVMWNKIADPNGQLSTTYYELVAPYVKKYSKNLLDSNFLMLQSYRNNISRILEECDSSSIGYKKIKDFQTAKALFFKLSRNKNNKSQIRNLSTAIHHITEPGYKNEIQKTYDILMAFGNGDKAIDFTTYHMDGRKGRLSDLRGKVIFIDLWATWCAPCLDEMPYFEKLKERYKNTPNVAFVSLCVNDSKENWKNNLIKRKATGIQLFANSKDIHDYRIVAIPRTIIINKDFEIERISGPLPSNNEVDEILNNLITGF